jgi:hypothetical protein
MDEQTPINVRPKRRPTEALEDLSLALREHLVWPVEDWVLCLGGKGRAAVAGGAVVVALGLGVAGYSIANSGGFEQAPAQPVAATFDRAPEPAPVAKPEPKPEPEPTLQGAAPVLKAPVEHEASEVSGSKAIERDTSSAGGGDPATDTFSTTSAARPSPTSASASTSKVNGPPAGPEAVAVAREFADAFVVYETGGKNSTVRKTFAATAAPQVTRALLRRPPRQPAAVKVPKAKVLNLVPAPSHDGIYPVSVSLLRVGVTSELRLEMERLKKKQWRVVNVLG